MPNQITGKTDLSVLVVAPETSPHSSLSPAAATPFPWLILVTILLAPLITVINVFIMNVSMPTIQQFFHASDAAVQGIIASYLVGYSVFLITGSRAGDHFGRKKIFIGGLFVFTIASALCGYAGSIGQLIVFRFFQGIAAGFAVPQTVTLIQLNFKHGEYRSKALGYYGITLGVASVLGQFLGGYFVSAHWMHEPWRLIFLINIPIGLLAVIMAAAFIPESKLSKKANFDMGGVILLTAGLSALIYPIIQGRELGWPAWTLALLLLSFVVLAGFIRYQVIRIRSDKGALLPLHLFRIRSFNMGLVMVFFYFALFSAFLCYGLGAGLLVPSFLKIALKDLPPEQAGIASGVYSTVQQFSSALGVSLIGGVFFYVLQENKGNFDKGYHAALWCLMGYSLAILVLLFLFGRQQRQAVL